MWVAILTVTLLALATGLTLSIAMRRLPAAEDDVAEKVNALLPQTQCAQCGYPGCRPYAAAIVSGDADINLCPPGGEDTVRRIATLLGREPMPLIDAPSQPEMRTVAVIDEERCIGCLHCRNACPVDAIVGAQQYMHTVINVECTGCELCLPPCPVDCISMVPVQ